MKKVYILVCAALCALTSCISEKVPDCPPLGISLAVKDKNYFNIDAADPEHRLPENLPFRQYVSTIYWTLRDVNTGEVVEQQALDQVYGEDQILRLDFCDCIPHGRYVFTAYGNLPDMSRINEQTGTMALHVNHDEGPDLYLCNDTIDYDPWHNGQTLQMERAKDKLLVQVEGLHADRAELQLQAVGVATSVYPMRKDINRRFTYYGTTDIQKTDDLLDGEMSCLLAPSQETEGIEYENASTLVHAKLTVEKDGQTRVIELKDVDIEMIRNTIEVIRYVFEEEDEEKYEIFVLVNDTWEKVHGMDMD